MENYSPSHPTDDMDNEFNDNAILREGSMGKNGSDFSDVESNAWNKELSAITSKSPLAKRSHSQSLSKQSRSRSGSYSRNRNINDDSRNNISNENPIPFSNRNDNSFNKFSDFQRNSPKRMRGFEYENDVNLNDSTSQIQETFTDNSDQLINNDNRNQRFFGGRRNFDNRRGKVIFRGFQRVDPWSRDEPNFQNERFRNPDNRNRSMEQNSFETNYNNEDPFACHRGNFQNDFSNVGNEKVKPRIPSWSSYMCENVDQSMSGNDPWEESQYNYGEDSDLRSNPWTHNAPTNPIGGFQPPSKPWHRTRGTRYNPWMENMGVNLAEHRGRNKARGQSLLGFPGEFENRPKPWEGNRRYQDNFEERQAPWDRNKSYHNNIDDRQAPWELNQRYEDFEEQHPPWDPNQHYQEHFDERHDPNRGCPDNFIEGPKPWEPDDCYQGQFPGRPKPWDENRNMYDGEFDGRPKPWEMNRRNFVGEPDARPFPRERHQHNYPNEFDMTTEGWRPTEENIAGECPASEIPWDQSEQSYTRDNDARIRSERGASHQSSVHNLPYNCRTSLKPWEPSGPDSSGECAWDQNQSNVAPRNMSRERMPGNYPGKREVHTNTWANNSEVDIISNAWGQSKDRGSGDREKPSVSESKNDDSEEEYGAWGKKDKIDGDDGAMTVSGDPRTTISDDARLGGRPPTINDTDIRCGARQDTFVDVDHRRGFEDVREWERPRNRDSGRDSNVRGRGRVTSQSGGPREAAEGGFVAWKNAQRAEAQKKLDATVPVETGEDFGAWGKENRENKDDLKSSGTIAASKNEGNDDSEEEFGAWGNEQKGKKSPDIESSLPENNRNGIQEAQFHDRRTFTNQSHDQSTMAQPSFLNNQFERPSNDNLFFNNLQNVEPVKPTEYGSSGPQAATSQASRPMPNYSYQHSQLGTAQSQGNVASYPSEQSTFPSNTSSLSMELLSQIRQQLQQTSSFQQMSFVPPPPPNTFSCVNEPWNNAAGTMSQQQSLSMDQSSVSWSHMGDANQPGFIWSNPAIAGPATINWGHTYTADQSGLNQPHVIDQSSVFSQASRIPEPPIPKIVTPPTSAAHASIDSILSNTNLLETLMIKAGLSSDSLRPRGDMKQDDTDKFSTILKTATNSVLSRLVENSHKTAAVVRSVSNSMSMSPSSSPPRSTSPPSMTLPAKYASIIQPVGFVPPPMPVYGEVQQPTSTKNILGHAPVIDDGDDRTTEIDEEKRKRSDFDTKIDWQERVALEVKLYLKPAFLCHSIDKNDYKEIMKRCVTKITRSGVTEIHSDKIEKFVQSYVEKYNKNKKVTTRQRRGGGGGTTVSSSD